MKSAYHSASSAVLVEAPPPQTRARRDGDPDSLNEITDFPTYLHALQHRWLRVLTGLGFTLVPAFFLLDWFMIPERSRHLLPVFGLLRLAVFATVVLQYIVIKRTQPSRYSFLHGYFFTLMVAGAIVLMTVYLGGFNSPYYAGVNLVIIAVNLLLPWHGWHSTLNGVSMVVMYLVANAVWGGAYDTNLMVNNLYFLSSTVIIAASINHVKYQLIQKEFEGRQDLKHARDALWGEMEIAKRIQTALLPRVPTIAGWEIGAAMVPAAEVGGDYYDVIAMPGGPSWVLIGDVSGHGVESGLIMMMTQTSVQSILRSDPHALPSHVVDRLNGVIKDNIARLGVDRYMTFAALRFDGPELMFAGKHQDILIYRQATGGLETIPTEGSWVGVIDELLPHLNDRVAALHVGDLVLLFTDGITESVNGEGEMFGQERLQRVLRDHARLPVAKLITKILDDVAAFQQREPQADDLTLVLLRKLQ
jgi:serine phosphatase RsbU (regulator of sigma subunit)